MGLLGKLIGRSRSPQPPAEDGRASGALPHVGPDAVAYSALAGAPPSGTPYHPEAFTHGRPDTALSPEEREKLGIIDESRHWESIGRR